MALTKQTFYKPEEKPESIIEFSFDDNFIQDMQFADILEKYGFKGTFYVIIDKVGMEGHTTWDQIKDLDKRGHTIGSHTLSHPEDLKRLYDEDLHVEIQNSKDMLETVLGHNISKFCYPRGRYDERVKQFVAEAGYVHARVTGKPGNILLVDTLSAPGTVQLYQRAEYEGVPVLDYAKKVIDKVKTKGGYCNIWGHGKEVEDAGLMGVFEEIVKYVSTGK